MTFRIKSVATLTVAGLAAAGLAACSSSSSGSGSSSGTSNAATPVPGGILQIVAASGPDHIDTVPAYYTADYILERAYARQLVSYPTVPDPTITSAGWTADTTPVPDIATAMPTLTNNNTTYTFHLKTNVFWNTTPKRAVVADDFIREFKAFCNPVAPVGNQVYYTATIKGLSAYCAAETAFFAKIKTPTAAQIAGFQNGHTISGITAPNPTTLVFNLIKPASDFIYMLAMPFASARPVEYDSYIPDSIQMRQHTISDGPYQITSYVAGKSITFAKNPAWVQASDSLRHQYVDGIQVTIGITDAQTQLTDMKAGTYDFSDDTGVQPSAIQQLLATKDPKFFAWPGSNTVPYVVFNLRSPNSGGAMGNPLVRQAIEYGINKVAVQKALGGAAVTQIINTAIPPGNVGFQNYNLYSTPGNQGDTAKCKALLAQAHVSNLTLTYLVANDSINQSVAQAISGSLASCGITLKLKSEAGSSIFVDLGNAPVNNKAGTWDLGQAGWFPDWYGNNGRTIIAPLFQTDCVLNTINYGCYSNSTVDSLINTAESAPNLTAAAAAWHQADVQVMKDAVIVPMIDQDLLSYSSARAHQVGTDGKGSLVFQPNIGGPDVTNIWLH